MISKSADGELWRPAASLASIRHRATLLKIIRQYFEERNVLEVETPILSSATVTDPNIDSFTTDYVGPGHLNIPKLYLHTSPEYAMKRLLAAGSGAIYQICKVFRQAEWGSLHNPEFTMLEWYRPGFDHYQLMTELDELVRALNAENTPLAETEYYTYSEVFQKYLTIDPMHIKNEDLIQCARDNHLSVEGLAIDDRDAWLDLVFSHIIQPQLKSNRLIFITDYPISQAALANVSSENNQFAQRFELFFNGVELANGYNELADASILMSRFESDQQQRMERNKPAIAIDMHLLNAINNGFPQCSGVAVGLDRLIMVLTHEKNIENVIAFPINRA